MALRHLGQSVRFYSLQAQTSASKTKLNHIVNPNTTNEIVNSQRKPERSERNMKGEVQLEFDRIPYELKPKQSPFERFALFNNPHLMYRSMSPTQRLWSRWCKFFYSKAKVQDDDWDDESFLHANEDASAMVCEALRDDHLDRLNVLCDSDFYVRLRRRNESLSKDERFLFDLTGMAIVERFIHSVSYYPELIFDGPFRPFGYRRYLIKTHAVLYYVRNVDKLEKKFGKLSDKIIIENFKDVLVANLIFVRVIRPQLGDWKLVLANYFQPYSRTHRYQRVS